MNALARRILEAQPTALALAQEIAREVEALPADPRFAPNQPQVFICGGFVRDALFGIEPNDLDLQVYGVAQKTLTEIIQRLYPGKVTVFRAIKVEFDEQFVLPLYEVDIGIVLRLNEKKERYFEDADPSIPPEEAARLGDFTCNSLLANPFTGEVVDYLGGIKDISQGVLRVCCPEHFVHYPFLVYRGVQMASRFGLRPDAECEALFRGLVQSGELDGLEEGGRVREEISKLLLKSPKPSFGITLLKEFGILQRYFPEVVPKAADPTGALEDGDRQGDRQAQWQRMSQRLDRAAHCLEDLSLARLEGRDCSPNTARSSAPLLKSKSDRLVVLLSALTFELSEEETKQLLLRFGYRRGLCLRSLLARRYYSEIFSLYAVFEADQARQKAQRAAGKKGGKNKTSKAKAPAKAAGAAPGRPRLGMISIARPQPTRAPVAKNPYANYHRAVQELLRLLHPTAWPIVLVLAVLEREMQAEEVAIHAAIKTFVQHVCVYGLQSSSNDLLRTEELVGQLNLPNGFHIGFIKGAVNKRKYDLLYPERALEWVSTNVDQLLQEAREREESLAE